MSYAIISDLTEAFGEPEIVELSNLDSPSATTINTRVANRALDDGTDEIDGYLQGKVALPLESPPRRLKAICCDIARYRMDRNRVREDVRDRYKDAIAYLSAVSKGIVQLGLDVVETVAPENDGPDFVTVERIFTSDSLSDYTRPGYY